MSKNIKPIESQNLKDWRRDTGRSQRALASELSVEQSYISSIETGKITPGETLKETFRNKFPGYDVIEMRPGQEEPVVEQPIEQKAPEVLKTEEIIEQPSSKDKTIIYLLERDGDTIAYGSKEDMHQDIICLAIAELGIETREVELR